MTSAVRRISLRRKGALQRVLGDEVHIAAEYALELINHVHPVVAAHAVVALEFHEQIHPAI